MSHALVVSRYFPFNPRRIHAVYQRLGTQIEALGRVASRVECLFLVPPEQDRSAAQLAEQQAELSALWSAPLTLQLAPVAQEDTPAGRWRRLGAGIFNFGAHPIARPVCNGGALAALRTALARQPRLVLAHRLGSMHLLRAVRSLLGCTPVFFDIDDLEHVAWTRRLWSDPAWPGERLLLLQIPSLMLAERRAVRLATSTFVCSDGDRHALRALSGSDRVITVPNSVLFPPVQPGLATEPLVLFVGSMGSRPNAHAVDQLVQQVWPLVQAQLPAARLAIIGSGAELTQSHATADPSVSFPGFVEDLESWYRRARVICCPISHGSGTRVKLIEAAAHARAIVATPLAAEGLRLQDGTEILLRQRPAELAAACLELLRDPLAASRIGQAARARAAVFYERRAIVGQLERIFRNTGVSGLQASTA
jgi:glycosyltransferase involved in cell wall biosynthesis